MPTSNPVKNVGLLSSSLTTAFVSGLKKLPNQFFIVPIIIGPVGFNQVNSHHPLGCPLTEALSESVESVHSLTSYSTGELSGTILLDLILHIQCPVLAVLNVFEIDL